MHHSNDVVHATIAIVTLSDTRTVAEDKSGQLIRQLIDDRHKVGSYTLIPDDPQLLTSNLLELVADPEIDVILCNGGTGMSKRDYTYATIKPLLDKELVGFGEQFRQQSYKEIGVKGLFSNAIAGTINETALFALPGSSNAVKLGMETFILPMLPHLLGELRK
ncbi:MogA/MoaB family molybdenum cofactor biosynthesis protein [Shouchella lehensis]|uniref:Molybdenum cofactor biosynthesis protein B n=4 Tax=Bacillaceae TaxID=186817 RepID=A0A060LWP9_9BACI|nr:MogA/MoaB family molybdenum cofactor biosynthesis protein [Shouchella lehensis]KQL57104.1 molybdenum cofactor biosynthesis protein B [Alkalicoccobacillus plakortidis]RQW21411.1 MogA/MoaB family molybdenum cofactor biosynthesis protein [Bacillus sp. C1-1]AIC95701.1 Molybdenum cofactor biosynthesis protein B [Shouchella lehensis G1]MBG9783608.1 molybdenum cofactor biosynthesis protein B [Shouchella lehensis]TES51444.1 MogA/MoaB family molybdenum cofactor biosynthesis protein [Shouchella lehen